MVSVPVSVSYKDPVVPDVELTGVYLGKDPTVASWRDAIDYLDGRIINLILLRRAWVAEVKGLKVSVGLPARDLSREHEVVDFYYKALGDRGVDVASALLGDGA